MSMFPIHIENAFAQYKASNAEYQQKLDKIMSSKRVQVLQEYKKQKLSAIENLNPIERLLHKEYYLAKCASDLIYLNTNRMTLEYNGRDKFGGDKAIMTRIIANKMIGRGHMPFNAPLRFMNAHHDIELTHAL